MILFASIMNCRDMMGYHCIDSLATQCSLKAFSFIHLLSLQNFPGFFFFFFLLKIARKAL